MHETFLTLLQDPAHWEFELFLMFLFDILLGMLLIPKLKAWKTHHRSDDDRVAQLEKEVKELKAKLKD